MKTIEYEITQHGYARRTDFATYLPEQKPINESKEIALMRLGWLFTKYRGPYHFLHVACPQDGDQFEMLGHKVFNSVTMTRSRREPFIDPHYNVVTMFDSLKDIVDPEIAFMKLKTKVFVASFPARNVNNTNFEVNADADYIDSHPLILWSIKSLSKLLSRFDYTIVDQIQFDTQPATTTVLFRHND